MIIIAYNGWITVAKRQSTLDPALKVDRFRRSYKLTAYAVSTSLLVLCWAVIGIATSHKYLGHLFFASGSYELAGQHFRIYLESGKEDYQVYYELAKSYRQLGDNKQYIEALEALLQKENLLSKFDKSDRLDREYELHTDLALALMWPDYIPGISDIKKKALVHVNQARLLKPNHPALLMLLGYSNALRAKEELPNPQNSELVIDSIFERAKDNIESSKLSKEEYRSIMWWYYFWLGRSLSEIGLYDRAKETLNTGLALVNEDPVLRKLARDSFLFKLGEVEFFKTEDLAKASGYWKDISDEWHLARALTFAGFGYYKDGEAAENEGKELMANKRFDDAEAALSAAMQLGERSFQLYWTLGILYYKRKEYIQATVNFELATKLAPSEYLGFYWLGRAKYEVGESLEEARQAMAQAVELKPDESEVHFWLGQILSKTGDDEAAISEYEKSIGTNPNNAKAYAGYLVAVLGADVFEQQTGIENTARLEKALHYAREGLSNVEVQKQTDAVSLIKLSQNLIWNSLAYEHADRGDHLVLAKKYVENALQSGINDADYPSYLNTKGWVLVRIAELSQTFTPEQKKMEYDRAEAVLIQSLNLWPKDHQGKADVLFHLSYIEMLRRRPEKARDFLLEALEINPQHEKAKDLSEKL